MKYTHDIVGTHGGALLSERAPGACSGSKIPRVAGLGENQDTVSKRINSWREGYMKGQPDIMIMNNQSRYYGLCIEFKSPNNNFKITDAQR